MGIYFLSIALFFTIYIIIVNYLSDLCL